MIRQDRWDELWTLLWAIRDGKISDFRIKLNHGERPDHFDSAVDSFMRKTHLLLEHHTQKATRVYYVRLKGPASGTGARVENPYQTT